MEGARGCGKGVKGSYLLMGIEFLFGAMIKLWKWIVLMLAQCFKCYLMLLNYIFKYGSNDTFSDVYFTTIRTILKDKRGYFFLLLLNLLEHWLLSHNVRMLEKQSFCVNLSLSGTQPFAILRTSPPFKLFFRRNSHSFHLSKFKWRVALTLFLRFSDLVSCI